MIDAFFGRYRFLSNFWMVDIHHHNRIYPSVEHAYQASKSKNKRYRISIQRTYLPGTVKRKGNKVRLREDWEQIKLPVMEALLRQKFNERLHPGLYENLMSTVGQELIERNWWHDNFWGSCTCDQCGNNGENHLGLLLMKIRDE